VDVTAWLGLHDGLSVANRLTDWVEPGVVICEVVGVLLVLVVCVCVAESERV
jgi:hypothetical protein